MNLLLLVFLCFAQTAEQGIIHVPSFYFEHNSSSLSPQDSSLLNECVSYLNSGRLQEHFEIGILANTACNEDNRESLGQRRANALYEYLKDQGVSINPSNVTASEHMHMNECDCITTKECSEEKWEYNRYARISLKRKPPSSFPRLLAKDGLDSAFRLSDTTGSLVGQNLISRNVFFELSEDRLNPVSFVFLDSLSNFLNDHPDLRIEISNHSDERSPIVFSNCLTCQRAKAIKEYLIQKGIDGNRLEASGYRSNRPIIKNAKTEEEHQINRRTEFLIIH